MGVSGALIPSNQYYPGSWYSQTSASTAQQALSNIAPQAQAQAQAQQWRQPTVTIMAAHEKIRIQIARLIDALPTSVCSRITRVDFFPSFQEIPMKFTIIFDSGKTLDVFDVDNFPSDEHLAQIALDCP